MRLVRTAKFSVIDERSVARLSLRSLRDVEALLRRQGFVILCDLGDELERRLAAYEAATRLFFETCEPDKKAQRAGGVYVSERGVPMFRKGYEEQLGLRECFRVAYADVSRSDGAWCVDEKSAETWRRLLVPLKRIADAALRACVREEKMDDDDFSLAFAFRYGEDATEGVSEHCDKSLIVVSPISDVEGLEVFDLASQRWLSIETLATHGKELLLFGGTALQAASGIPACKHRVRFPPSHDNRKMARYSLIFELKYGHYYRHLRHFGD